MPAAGATETTSDVLSQAPRPKESWEGIIAKDDRSLYRKRAAYGPIGLMGKIELADAKARLSALVDDVQYRRRKTLILRHGKPSAAIVPVDAAMATERAARRPIRT